jgi:serine/threonine-protein kinase HipA
MIFVGDLLIKARPSPTGGNAWVFSLVQVRLSVLLGRDLPGAVVVRNETDSSRSADARELLEVALNTAERAPPIRFSLAGVQLKLSMTAAKDKLTIPAKDQVGDIIAKLPNAHYPFMPELEFTAMKLAAAAGVEIAGVRLMPISAVIDLPTAWQRYGEHILAVDRFDRFVGAEGVQRRHRFRSDHRRGG